MAEELEQINKLYDDIINASYFTSLLTSRAQKIQSYNDVAIKYVQYITNNENLESSTKIEIYKKIIYLYEYLNIEDEIIKYKLKYYELLNDEEFINEIRKIDIPKFLKHTENDNLKIKFYKYLITINSSSKIDFIDFIISLKDEKLQLELIEEFVELIKELFISNLKTTKAKKYAELLIKYNKDEYLKYCCEIDPLISNIDYYKSL